MYDAALVERGEAGGGRGADQRGIGRRQRAARDHCRRIHVAVSHPTT